MLGVDLGTSALKLVAVSRTGEILATARESYPTVSAADGRAEQDAELWLKALSTAARKVMSRLPANTRVEAIALTGQMPTLVILRDNKPIGRAITWQDSRADRWAGARVNDQLRRDIYLRTGVLVDGRYLAPMFEFHHEGSAVDIILSAKDFIFLVLTGVAATDPSTASGYALYNLRTNRWDSEFCIFWHISPGQLPAVEGSSYCAPLTKHGSRLLACVPGIPVFLGCADSVAGAYALSGGTKNLRHSAAVLTGTSTVIMTCDSRPHWDRRNRYLLTPFAVDGWYAREADLLASGSAREWAESFLQRGAKHNESGDLWQSAYKVAPGADGLFFSPYLGAGEQGVLWNPSLRGTLTGLTLNHDAAKIARALLEGMCFEIRRCLEVLEEGTGRSSKIFLAGWMAASPEESQTLADITGKSVHAVTLSCSSAIGAALLSGIIDCEKVVKKAKSADFSPGERRQSYERIYKEYIAQFPLRGRG